MTQVCGSLVGIKPDPEPDGSHMIQVADFGGEPFEVLIHSFQVAELVKALQQGLVERSESIQMPIYQALSIALAHRQRDTALMVDTAQIGRVALHCSPQVLRQLRSEIDRALTYLDGPPITN